MKQMITKKLKIVMLCLFLSACTTSTKESSPEGKIYTDRILEVTTLKQKEMRQCYQGALQGKAVAPTGLIKLEFIIGSDGKVVSTRILENSLQVAEISDCVVDTFREMRFPPPEGGEEIHVKFPLRFESKR